MTPWLNTAGFWVICTLTAVPRAFATPPACDEQASESGEPSALQVRAAEYWHYVLYVDECAERKFLQVDYVVERTPYSLVFELNEEEKLRLTHEGSDYLVLLRKVAAFNHEQFERERHIAEFSSWRAVRSANERYFNDLLQ